MIVTREEAITIIDNLHLIGCGRNQHEYDLKINVALDMAIEALQSDRPQGEWIDVNGDGSLWRCSRCKDTACCDGNYCPTCGAKMYREDGEA